MALENCKECNAQISSKAKTCPSCGTPIKRTSFTTKIVAGLIGLSIVMSIFGSISSKNDSEKQAKAEQDRLAALTPEQRKVEQEKQAAIVKINKEAAEAKSAVYACQTFITNNMKDPSSVDFLYKSNEAPVTKNKKGIYEVQQKVRAKNSFGALTVNYINCKTQLIGTDWHSLGVKVVR